MGRRQKHGSVPSSNHRLDIRVKAEKGPQWDAQSGHNLKEHGNMGTRGQEQERLGKGWDSTIQGQLSVL